MGRLKKLSHKIISIQPQKRSKNRYNIIFESGDVFGISGDVLISSTLSTGTCLSDEELVKVKIDEVLQKIKEQILHLLSYRARSRFELFTRMSSRGFEKDQVYNVIDELESKGYIDDKEFSKMYALHLVKSKYLGKIAVKHHFLKHQISPEILDPILDELYIEYPTDTLIQKIINKKKLEFTPELISDKKLMSHIKRKGFSWGEITSALNSF